MTWAATKKVFEITDFALLSPTETLIPERILKQCAASVPGAVDDIAISGPVTKAWYQARRILENGKEAGMVPGPVDEAKFLTLDDAWQYRHGGPLDPSRKVGQSLMQTLLKISVSSPPYFPILSLEKITIESHCTSADDNSKKNNGQPPPDPVLFAKDTNMIYLKMRALLISFCYVSVQTPEWMNLTVADVAIEQIYTRIVEGNSYPGALRFFKNAYVSTMQAWQTSICSYKTSLADAVKDRGWLSFWNVPGQPEGGWRKGGGKGGKGEFPFSKKSLRNEVWSMVSRFTPGGGKSGGGKSGGKQGGGKSGGWDNGNNTGFMGGKQGGGKQGQRPYNGFLKPPKGGGKGKGKDK